MGDLPSSTLEDGTTVEALTEEIRRLREERDQLRAQRSDAAARELRLLGQPPVSPRGLAPDPVLEESKGPSASPSSRCGFGQVPQSLPDRVEIMLHAAQLRQHQALDDFRSAVAERQQLEKTSSLAKESKPLYDAFHIGYQGPFATINGVRLGAEAALEVYDGGDEAAAGASGSSAAGTRGVTGSNNGGGATTVKVPWSEINSALGLLALLLSSLERKPHAGVRYRHEVVCSGSTSKIGLRRDGGSTAYYNLYSDDSFQFFGRRHFNTALQCLVQCVVDASDAIQRRDPTIHLPHPIDRTPREFTIGGLPVAYGTDGGVEWTRAMKYLLTNVKHLSAYRAFGLWDVVLGS
jgi:hypothetical protein